MFKDAAFDVFRFYTFYGNNVDFAGSEIRVTGYVFYRLPASLVHSPHT